jgi:sulfane dehydrogenase subunit SoxC
MITPNGLHFERSHSGIPEISPDAHRLVIHGLVKRPLIFTLESFARYPMESRITFLECAGNGRVASSARQQWKKSRAPDSGNAASDWVAASKSTVTDSSWRRLASACQKVAFCCRIERG